MASEDIRRLLAVALPLLLLGSARAGSPLKVELDKSRVDLPGRKLELRMNHPAGHVELKIQGPTGAAPLVDTSQDFSGSGPGQTLVVTWPEPGGEIARIDLRAYDSAGAYVGF